MSLIVLRILFLAMTAATAYVAAMAIEANEAVRLAFTLAAALLAALIILVETRIERSSARKVVVTTLGLLLGLLAANLVVFAVLGALPEGSPYAIPMVVWVVTVFAYLGLALGARKGEEALIQLGLVDKPELDEFAKILDTSVIIDGRIADIVETRFLDGVIVIPQFVLHELQYVADSADSLKRVRGRRGLDVLKKIQKQRLIEVRIVEEDFPEIHEVDRKLVELAKLINGKVVTNDFNLAKVAELQGVTVLNINNLSNALKPVILPGELMNVRIVKEGKEPGQGVGYLDDGTMVVVDSAKRFVTHTVEVSVTSVLQTSAGRMIFAKMRGQPHEARADGTNDN